MEYLERDQLAILTGHVRIGVEDGTIEADTVRFDQAKGALTADGHLVWISPSLSATGSRMTYDLNTREGDVDDVSLTAGLWLCRGDRVSQTKHDEVDVAPGLITTCDRPSPHYAIRCRTIHIRLNRDLTARNVLVCVGGVPVLWLPWLYTPLREFRLPFEAQAGHTTSLGGFVRTSPAYALGMNAPGQARLDWFQRKGFGFGATQELLDAKGNRVARVHGYEIKERTSSGPGVPRRRWELFGEGGGDLGADTRVAAQVAEVSDAHFRESYGYRTLPVPLVAGDRRASALVTRRLGWADATVQADRTDTQRVSGFSATDTGRYALATVRAPRVALDGRPWPLASWLSVSARAEAQRGYDWLSAGDDPAWYVTRAGISPALEAYGRIPGAGRLTVTPRLSAEWRDRGDRVLLADNSGFVEDANRGGVYRGGVLSTLRRPLPLGADAELDHEALQALNKPTRDPFEARYHGLELHQVRGRLELPLGGVATAGVRGGFDLRDAQDIPARRWLPLNARAGLVPRGGVSLAADGDFDLWAGAWRRIGGTAGWTAGGGGPSFAVRPSYTDNRLLLPVATTTSPEYRVATRLYGPSVTSAALYPKLFLVDVTVSTPVAPGFRATLTGQADALPPSDLNVLPAAVRGPVQRHIRFYTFTLVRDLHCWELAGAFERYASGELRFNASLNLKAFPTQRFPLVAL